MTPANPPNKHTKKPRRQPSEHDEDESDLTDADIIAEEIEAEYDLQADAAIKSLSADPASSSDNDLVPDA